MQTGLVRNEIDIEGKVVVVLILFSAFDGIWKCYWFFCPLSEFFYYFTTTDTRGHNLLLIESQRETESLGPKFLTFFKTF